MTDITVGASTLTEYSDGDNSRTWVNAGHTNAKPQLVIQKRKIPGNQADLSAFMTSSFKVVYGTVDASGDPMAQKISLECTARHPQGALAADLTNAIALFQEFVADADFDDAVKKALYYT
jgi:hypothetical protein